MEFNEEEMRKWEKIHRRGKIAGGIMIAVIGTIFLGRELGAELPDWLFSWKPLLIAFGIVGFVKHGFSRVGWVVPILIGGIFLVADLYPGLAIKPILWPVALIIVGLFIAFKPRGKHRHHHFRRRWEGRGRGHGKDYNYDYDYNCSNPNAQPTHSNEDFIESTSVMGGVKKNVLSKNFKGGDITNIFGGCEINLSQADFEGKVTLEITQVFGGTKLIVPSNWNIQSNIDSILGSVEDKRPVNSQTGTDEGKVLILNGTTVLGGIEIRTF